VSIREVTRFPIAGSAAASLYRRDKPGQNSRASEMCPEHIHSRREVRPRPALCACRLGPDTIGSV
jgi:hypothetical protein